MAVLAVLSVLGVMGTPDADGVVGPFSELLEGTGAMNIYFLIHQVQNAEKAYNNECIAYNYELMKSYTREP